MSIRNSSELGTNLLKIVTKLSQNKRLLRLLKYTDNNPFSQDKEEVDPSIALDKNLKVVPLVNEHSDDTESTVVVMYNSGTVMENKEFKDIALDVLVYVPLTEWKLNDINLRPFLIMTEIEKELKGKRVESLGKIEYEGFSLQLVTDIMSCYRMEFYIHVFD